MIRDGQAQVDASWTERPFVPPRVPNYELAVDRSGEDKEKEWTYHKFRKIAYPQADNEARWLKKGKKIIDGFRKHIGTDNNGMIWGVHTTPAHVPVRD